MNNSTTNKIAGPWVRRTGKAKHSAECGMYQRFKSVQSDEDRFAATVALGLDGRWVAYAYAVDGSPSLRELDAGCTSDGMELLDAHLLENGWTLEDEVQP